MKLIPVIITLACAMPFTGFCQSSGEPKELLDLRGSFEKARSAALSPLEKKYVDALTGLKDRLTKRGDLNGALAVQAELARMQQASDAPNDSDRKLRLSRFNTIDEFYAWLATTAWKSSTANILRFPSANVMELTSPDGRKSPYALTIEEIGKLSWVYSTGVKEVMTISTDLKTATCRGSGAVERIEP